MVPLSPRRTAAEFVVGHVTTFNVARFCMHWGRRMHLHFLRLAARHRSDALQRVRRARRHALVVSGRHLWSAAAAFQHWLGCMAGAVPPASLAIHYQDLSLLSFLFLAIFVRFAGK